MLPHLRLALMPLDPRETDRLGEEVALRIGVAGCQVMQLMDITEGEMSTNLVLDRELAALLAADGVI